MRRLSSLDFLRGLAGFAVAIPHFLMFFGIWAVAAETVSILAVDVFFALSGFVLAQQIDRCVEARSWVVYERFLTRRWMRTLPPLLFALALIAAIHGKLFTGEFLEYLFFVQNFAKDVAQNGFFVIGWSLAVEEWYYILFPLVLFTSVWYLHLSTKHVLVTLALVFMAAKLVALFFIADIGDDLRRVVLFRLDAIGWGYATFRYRGQLQKLPVGRIAAVAGIITIASVVLIVNGTAERPMAAVYFPASVVFCCSLLLTFLSGEAFFSRFAITADVAGRLSYPVYLFHLVFIQACASFAKGGASPLALLPAFVVGLGIFCYGFNKLIEQPILAVRPPLMPRQQEFGSPTLRHITGGRLLALDFTLFNSFRFASFAAIALAMLWAADYGLLRDRTVKPFMAALVTYDPYPFSGGNAAPNKTLVAGVDRFRTGDHGFMVDFDLDQPPTKLPNEKRVAIVGNSVAWGLGATSNASMFQYVAERELNLNPKCDSIFRFVNLAKPGANSYQNFIDLNLTNINLKYDIVVSLSGFGDFSANPGQTLNEQTRYPRFWDVGALVFANRVDGEPDWLKPAAEYFSGFLRQSNLALPIRLLDFRAVKKKFQSNMAERYPHYSEAETIEKVQLPFYVNALRSMAYDDPNRQLIVAFQPFMWDRRINDHARFPRYFAEADSLAPWIASYEKWIADTTDRLRPLSPGNIMIWNFHEEYQSRYLSGRDPAPRDPLHFGDDMQEIFGRRLAEKIAEIGCTGNGSGARKRPVANGVLDLSSYQIVGPDTRMSSTLVKGNSGNLIHVTIGDRGYGLAGWAGRQQGPQQFKRPTSLVALSDYGVAYSYRFDDIAGWSMADPSEPLPYFQFFIPWEGKFLGRGQVFALFEDGTAGELSVHSGSGWRFGIPKAAVGVASEAWPIQR